MTRNKQPTIADVARLANVSVGTVSHVLNGTTNVSSSRREQVERAISLLGYEQNMLAHAQRRQRAPVVGLSAPHVASAYLAALTDSFEDVAGLRGYQMMQVLTRRDPQIELRRVRELLRHRIAGLLMVSTFDPHRTLDLIHVSGTPAVLVDRPCDDDRFDQVTFDNRAVMDEAVAHLMRLGHQRFLFVVESQILSISRHRILALRARAGAAAAVVLEVGDGGEEYARRLTEILGGRQAPTAVIVSNSLIAARTLQVLRSLGGAYPERISLLAFEDSEWANLVDPGLSVIRQPVRDVVRAAWDILLRRMMGDTGPAQHVELQAELVLRGSVRPAVRRRPRVRSAG